MKFIYIFLFLFASFSLSAKNEDPVMVVQRIINSGDGKSLQTAYKVNNVNEEYLLLKHLNLKSVMQTLHVKDGVFYDAIQTNSKTVYFKIVTKNKDKNKIPPSLI